MDKAKLFIKSIIPGAYPLYRVLKNAYQAGRCGSSVFLQTYPAGHFYSPLPNLREVLIKENTLFKQDAKACPGVDLCEQVQLGLLAKFIHYYKELPFSGTPSGSYRYYYQNGYFSYGDAVVLYGMLRHLRPRQVVEVGSGFSSALMLDTNDAFLGGSTKFTFIEPNPERLLRLQTEKDRQNYPVIQKPVQDVELELFDGLEANDILFVDSSHVIKIGSDVARIIFNILPRLKADVYVHFHDVFWPFEYPKDWIAMGRAWNEAYFLRAFLQYNSMFKVVYFNSFMTKFYGNIIRKEMPLVMHNPSSSLWIRRSV